MRIKLGVMGGMGPEATSYFYENMIKHTGASCDQEHVDMVILSHASMPDRTACIASGDTENLVRLLIQDAHASDAWRGKYRHHVQYLTLFL